MFPRAYTEPLSHDPGRNVVQHDIGKIRAFNLRIARDIHEFACPEYRVAVGIEGPG